jgi:hypothetical protein
VNPLQPSVRSADRVSLAFFVAVPVIVAIWDYCGFLVFRDGLYVFL